MPLIVAAFGLILPWLTKLFLMALTYLLVKFLFSFSVWFKKAYLWVQSIGQGDAPIPESNPVDFDLQQILSSDLINLLGMMRIDECLSLIASAILFKLVWNFTSPHLQNLSDSIYNNNP